MSSNSTLNDILHFVQEAARTKDEQAQKMAVEEAQQKRESKKLLCIGEFPLAAEMS